MACRSLPDGYKTREQVFLGAFHQLAHEEHSYRTGAADMVCIPGVVSCQCIAQDVLVGYCGGHRSAASEHHCRRDNYAERDFDRIVVDPRNLTWFEAMAEVAIS